MHKIPSAMVVFLVAFFSFGACYGQAEAVRSDTYIVILDEPSVLAKILETSRGEPVSVRRHRLHTRAAEEYQRTVEASQERLLRDFRSRHDAARSLEVLSRRSLLLNMLVVRSDAPALELLRQHSGVKGIYPNRERKAWMDGVPSMVGLTAVWEALGGSTGAGQGVRIAIIDSGINRGHPMFADTGMAAPTGFPQPAQFSSFTNNKIIVARNYVTRDFGYASQELSTPEDERGHGTSVASVAAGSFVSTPYFPIQGMAPRAFLGNYKVFGQRGVNDTARTSAIIAAMDDAVSDGMHIINLSLGGLPLDPAADPEQEAVEQATAAGVLVVIAAGNLGPDAGTVSSPGTCSAALTVGATLHGRYVAPGAEITSTAGNPGPGLDLVGYFPASGQTVPTRIGPLSLVSISSLDASMEGCAPLPGGSLTGKAALMRRGTCLFAVKAANAFNAGAVAVVVHQNTDDPPFSMSGVEPQHFAIMIDKATGESLAAFLTSRPADITVRPQATLLQFPSQRDRIAAFSGRGPTLDGRLKPDMVAPGNSIFAAYDAGATATYSYDLSGTSFSAPILSGAAALLLQLHPGWSPEALKSSLVNTAERTTTWNSAAAGVIHTGNGRLNVDRAAAAAAMLAPVSVSFGVWRASPGSQVEQTIEVKYLASTGSLTFQPELIERVHHPNVVLSISPPALSLGPGQTGQLVLTAHLSEPLQYGVFEGDVRLSASGAAADIRAPYWGGISVEDRDSLLQISATGQAPYTSISSGLAAARPGGTIEITDGEDYPGPVTLGLNGDGIPLDGIELRNRQGQSPRIVMDAFEEPALTVNGLRNVTIDGISIRGGMAGLLASRATGRISNAKIDAAEYGVVFEDSRFDLLNTTISNATETGLLALFSRLNVSDSIIRTGDSEGVFLFASPALIQRSTISQNKSEGVFSYFVEPLSLFDSLIEKNGTGVIALDAPALLKGNVIKDSTGSEADGIIAAGTGARLAVHDTQILNNGRHGLLAESGADVRVIRSRFEQNQEAAVSVFGAFGNIKSSLLLSNGQGARSETADLTITDTLIFGSTNNSQGDGVYADKGKLTLLSSTVVGNRGRGVKIQGATHQVANSIFYNNSDGDAEGVMKGSAFSNLINDGILSNNDENFYANPRFAGTADFSLRAESPAIDRGNASFPITLTDVRGFERTVGSKTDLGAFEFGAESWTPLVLPVLSTRADEFVGLAFVNTASATSRVRLVHYDTLGRSFGTHTREVPAGAQSSLLLTEAFSNLKEGWVEIRSEQPDLMSFSLLGNWASSRMDGADLTAAISPRLLFPEVRARKNEGKETSLYIVNPNPVDVQVTLKWVTSQGVVPYNNLPIKAKGTLKVPFSEKFPESDMGYLTVEVQEGLPIFGMEIFGTAKSVGGLLALDMSNPSDTLFGAQLASTGEVETVLNLVSLGPTADTTIEAYDETGALAHSTVVRLNAGQQYKKSVREIFALTGNLVGWLRVASRGAGLIGSITFSDAGGNYLAALPLQARGSREFVLGHVAQTPEVFTGVTLLNASEGYAQVSLEVFDRDGSSKGLSLLELKPQEKRARLLSEYVPGLEAQEGGFVRVRSTLPIFGFELFARYDLTFMSAVPQQVVIR